jgi:glycosyltransferase involved in cell wall biosynthesis
MISASIIIATFNRVAILQKTLDALAAQTGDATFEVIIVDDGSTDRTAQVIEERIAAASDPFAIRYFNTGKTPIYGAAIARNIGIRNAQAEHILFFDDDCIPHPHCVQAHMKLFDQGENVIIGYISEDQKTMRDVLPPAEFSPSMKRVYELSQRNELTEFLTGNAGVRKECFARVGLFDERFARKEGYGFEDIEFGHRLLIGGYTIRFNPHAFVYTRPKSGEILKERDMNRLNGKRLWRHVILHPQENLPITPQLHQYAAKMRAGLKG